MTPERSSAELRRGLGDDLTRRRGTTALTLGAIGALAVVASHQMGLLKHVPEPPLPLLDADGEGSRLCHRLQREPSPRSG